MITSSNTAFLTKTYQKEVQDEEMDDLVYLARHRIPIIPIDMQDDTEGEIWRE